jgi:hypothetical protein
LNEETTIDVEIQDQFEQLFSGEAVTVTFFNELETATVTPESISTSNGHAIVTYKAGAEAGTDSILITAPGGLSTQVNIVIAEEQIRLPGVKNAP